MRVDVLTVAPSPTFRSPRRRHYVMCPPRYFDVRYTINEWMNPAAGADPGLALAQWHRLRETYLALGHQVDLLEPDLSLPDMVFAANGALAIGNQVLGASFAHPQRRPEALLHRRRFLSAAGADGPGGTDRVGATDRTGGTDRLEVVEAGHVNEGEGDFLVVGSIILAGTGFRTEPAAHREAQEFFGRPVITLQLTDPRFYHLDTAIAVLDDDTIAYYPGAFSPGSRQVLQQLFPGALLAGETDALALGLNAVSDGLNVVLPENAVMLAETLRRHGFTPIPIDLSELLKAGGSVKCCTMELHP